MMSAAEPSNAVVLCRISTLQLSAHTSGDNVVARALQNDMRQGACRRALYHGAVADGKAAVMARTDQLILFARVVNGARQMRALLRVSGVVVLADAHQQTLLLRIRIAE